MTDRPEPPRGAALREAALDYAARGWHVLPLRPGSKVPAFPDHPERSCAGTSSRDPRCRATGRHVPWERRATTEPDRITRAWSSPPTTKPTTERTTGWTSPRRPWGIGIACGPSGLVVVDLDTAKPDLTPEQRQQLTTALADHELPADATGADVLAVLAARAGEPVPATWTVTTPTGGWHLYFTAPTGVRLTNTAKALGPLIDTRAWGGQVAAPPTTTPHGTYTPGTHGPDGANAPVVELPGWLAARLAGHGPRPRPPHPLGTGTGTAPRGSAAPTGSTSASCSTTATGSAARRTAYLRAAVDAEARHVAGAQPGRRGTAVYIAAANLGELVAGHELTADDVRAALTTAAARHVGVGRFTAHELAAAIESGLRKGAGRPRRLATAGAAQHAH